MNFSGHILVDAAPAAVWEFLLDPKRLAGCVPGVEEVTQIDERTFDGTISATVGPMSGKFVLRATIVESAPPAELTARIQGTDSVTKSVLESDVVMTLTGADAGATDFGYRAEVNIKGRLAILGEMVLRATTSLMLEEFARRLQREFQGKAPAAGKQDALE